MTKSDPEKACVTYKGPEYLTDRVSVSTSDKGKTYKFDFQLPEVLQRIQEYALGKQPLPEDLERVGGISKVEGDEWMGLTLGGDALKFAVRLLYFLFNFGVRSKAKYTIWL